MNGFVVGFICGVLLIGMGIHVWTCVATNWAAMLILGLVIPPIGVVHGLGILIGVW